MAAAAGYMVGSLVFQGLTSLFSANKEAEARKKQAQFQSMISNYNAKILDFQAEDAYRRGEEDAQGYLKQGRQMQGTQRAALAAQGVEVDSGSAADIQSETHVMTRMDARKIRNNAAREAFGFKTQAVQSRMEAAYGMQAAESGARGTLLTGGLNALSSFAQAGYYGVKG